MEEEDTQVRIWVTHFDCAKIIGKGGAELREIESRSGARMRVMKEALMDPELQERFIDIVGARDAQRLALERVLELTMYCREDEGEVLKDTRCTNKVKVLEILPGEIGFVIGRNGEVITSIEKETGAKIQVDKVTGHLQVMGDEDAQDAAISLILAEVSYARMDGSVLKREERPEERLQEDSEDPPKRFFIRCMDAGKVIGVKGELVRQVKERTGASIQVFKDERSVDGASVREVQISGRTEAQEQALQLILAEVSWAQDFRGDVLKEAPRLPPPPQPPRPPPPSQPAKGVLRPPSKPPRGSSVRHTARSAVAGSVTALRKVLLGSAPLAA